MLVEILVRVPSLIMGEIAWCVRVAAVLACPLVLFAVAALRSGSAADALCVETLLRIGARARWRPHSGIAALPHEWAVATS